MSDVATPTTAVTSGSGSAAPKGLVARAFGVIFSPRDTYAEIAARPRILGAAIASLLIVVTASAAFLMTQVGKDALFDQQMRAIESIGIRVNDQMYDRMETQLAMAPYFAAAGQLVFTPVLWSVLAGLFIGVFNVILGGEATFKQVYAVVVHGSFLVAL